MMRKWIPIGLLAGLLAAAITGGAVLASDGDEVGKAGPDAEEVVVVKDGDVSAASIENTDVDSGQPDDLSIRVAEILGTDAQATHDAMVQADAAVTPNAGPSGEGDDGNQDSDSMSVEAQGLSYAEYGERVGAILGVDGEEVARAIAQAYEELYGIERDIHDTGSGQDAAGKYDSDKNPTAPGTD